MTALYLIGMNWEHSNAKYADLAELVDVQDLGSCVERRVGSSPTVGTCGEEQMDVRWAHIPEVAGSNPVPATIGYKKGEKRYGYIITILFYKILQLDYN